MIIIIKRDCLSINYVIIIMYNIISFKSVITKLMCLYIRYENVVI